MIAKLALIAAGMLTLAAPPCLAQSEAPPPDEALVERFMSVLPDRPGRGAAGDHPADAAELTRLRALNNGRDEEIRPILEQYERCIARVSRESAENGIRDVARRLGAEKVRRLIQFYEGEDFRRFEALRARLNAQDGGTPADRADAERIMAAYPLDDFYNAIRARAGAIGDDASLFTAFEGCDAEKRQALGRAGLRSQDAGE